MKKSILFLLCICFVTIACTSPNSTETPEWIEKLIQKIESQPVGNPPVSIWKYTYEKEDYYLISDPHPDGFTTLYDKIGNAICAPSGGIHGQGSGDCPDFVENLENAELVWKDSRDP